MKGADDSTGLRRHTVYEIYYQYEQNWLNFGHLGQFLIVHFELVNINVIPTKTNFTSILLQLFVVIMAK